MNQNKFDRWMREIKEDAGYSREILDNLFQEYQKKSGCCTTLAVWENVL